MEVICAFGKNPKVRGDVKRTCPKNAGTFVVMMKPIEPPALNPVRYMLKTILIIVAIVVIAFVIIVSLRPSEFRVTRSATIAASPAVVFEQINDLHNYSVWNPFGKHDPAIKTRFEGPRAGRDAAMHWVGNSQVGEGTMTITDSKPAERVGARLDFIRPFPSTAEADFTLTPQSGGTQVTWTINGHHTFIPKAVSLFMNMDKMIGGEFEKGLAELKTIVESDAKK
jgi:hypothetical protein